MKVYNITPGRNKRSRLKKKLQSNSDIELIEFNMTQGDKLKFELKDKDDTYFKINLNFKRHCMSRILCLN